LEIRPPARGRGAAADEADEHALACNAVLAELPGPRPGRLAAEALAATAEIGPENGKADILAWLINYLSGSLVPEAASISIALQDEALRVETLHALIPRLSVDVLSVVLAAAESISDSYHRSLLVEALATMFRLTWPPPEAHINSADNRTTPEYDSASHGR
jgi:hypothetical protein